VERALQHDEMLILIMMDVHRHSITGLRERFDHRECATCLVGRGMDFDAFARRDFLPIVIGPATKQKSRGGSGRFPYRHAHSPLDNGWCIARNDAQHQNETARLPADCRIHRSRYSCNIRRVCRGLLRNHQDRT
jgi:hypothetical protein